ncbi:hypothetical protein [Mycobacteroides franklinii]|uniref:hypothetical protein n=1 Tax=Mycobacteroides franklinii TaxID=948102 RepID=UPI0013E8DB23
MTVTAALRAPRALAAAALTVAASLTALAWAAPAAAGPAQPGPKAPGNAQTVITELKTRGDQVIVNGDTTGRPLSGCTAISVRVGRHIYNQVPQRKGPATRALASHVMYVTVQC